MDPRDKPEGDGLWVYVSMGRMAVSASGSGIWGQMLPPPLSVILGLDPRIHP